MAIEALAAGHAVVVADRFGIGGLVTLDRLDDFGQWNFAIGGLSAHPELSGLGKQRWRPTIRRTPRCVSK